MTQPRMLRAIRSGLSREAAIADERIREGKFQRSLALIAGLSSLLSGLEVTYEHYRGSYGQRIMYSPVILSPLLLVAGIWGFFSGKAARTMLPIVSGVTLVDSLVGFGFHVRGIQRKPGGWRVPVANIIMGPPIFAPLLFGISGYLGVIAAFLRREETPAESARKSVALPIESASKLQPGECEPDEPTKWIEPDQDDNNPSPQSWEQDIREGRFQKHLAGATAAASLFSGVEALYSHYKSNFRHKAQWSPVIIAPLLTTSAIAAIVDRRAAKTVLPVTSALAIVDGALGFYYHARGIVRRPGGLKLPLYNLVYGPPLFAPLLFAACGAMGLLATFMRREK